MTDRVLRNRTRPARHGGKLRRASSAKQRSEFRIDEPFDFARGVRRKLRLTSTTEERREQNVVFASSAFKHARGKKSAEDIALFHSRYQESKAIERVGYAATRVDACDRGNGRVRNRVESCCSLRAQGTDQARRRVRRHRENDCASLHAAVEIALQLHFECAAGLASQR